MENIKVTFNNFMERKNFYEIETGEAFIDYIDDNVCIKIDEEFVMRWDRILEKWEIQNFQGTGSYAMIKVNYVFG